MEDLGEAGPAQVTASVGQRKEMDYIPAMSAHTIFKSLELAVWLWRNCFLRGCFAALLRQARIR